MAHAKGKQSLSLPFLLPPRSHPSSRSCRIWLPLCDSKGTSQHASLPILPGQDPVTLPTGIVCGGFALGVPSLFHACPIPASTLWQAPPHSSRPSSSTRKQSGPVLCPRTAHHLEEVLTPVRHIPRPKCTSAPAEDRGASGTSHLSPRQGLRNTRVGIQAERANGAPRAAPLSVAGTRGDRKG